MTQVDGPRVASPLAVRPAAPPDRSELRSVLGRFATGVTVVTAGQDEPRGMTANSFTSVSLDPALVLVCVVRTAAIHSVILAEGQFAISVLASHQDQVAKHFADHRRPRGDEEFAVVDWTPGRFTGAPVMVGALAWLECRVTAVHDGGDHSIFLGSVLGAERGPDRDALLYFGGGFRTLDG